MDLAITLHRDELVQAMADFLPMRLLLGKLEGIDDPAWVQIDAIETATFVPCRGLRLSCAARIHYPLPVVPDDFAVQHATLEMVPAIAPGPGGAVLAFRLDVGDFELKYLPEVVDRTVARKINEALCEHATSIAWDFTKTLTRMVQLPERLRIVRTLELRAPRGEVQVTEDSIVLQLSVDVSFHHAGDVAEVGPGAHGA